MPILPPASLPRPPLDSGVADVGSPGVVLGASPHDPPHLAVVVARVADAAGMSLRRTDVTVSGEAGLGVGLESAVAIVVLTPGAVSALAPTAPSIHARPSAVVEGTGGVARRVVVADDPDGATLLHGSLALGAERVLAVTDELDLLTCVRAARDAARTRALRRGRVVGVRPVTGGAGASSLAATLALEVARGAVLVDADAAGAGVEALLGDRWTPEQDAADVRDDHDTVPGWARLRDLDGQVDPTVLLERLPAGAGLRVVGHGRGPRAEPPAARLALVVEAASRSGSTVVVDLPRRTPGSLPCDDEVLVVPCTVPGVDAAFRSVAGVAAEEGAGLLGADTSVLPARRWVVARRARAGLHPVEVAEALGLPLLAEVAHDRRLDEHVALGLGVAPRRRSAWARAAQACVAGLGLDAEHRDGAP